MAETGSLDAVAAALVAALEQDDMAALGALLHEDVTWGDCAGRAEVEAFLGTASAAVGPARDVAVVALADRLALSLHLGDGSAARAVHQAVFVEDGRIIEIRDVAGPDAAAAERAVGPLDRAAARPAHATTIAPVFPVRDVTAAIAHYRALGFDASAYEGDAPYGFAERDDVSLHLAQVDELDPATNTSAAYLYVDDADALYAQWRRSGAGGRHVAPTDTEYGLREGAHIDPDGNLIRFGSPAEGAVT